MSRLDGATALALAEAAARRVAPDLVRRFSAPAQRVETKSSADDLVSDADRESEQAIVAMIRAVRPDDEEGGEQAGEVDLPRARRDEDPGRCRPEVPAIVALGTRDAAPDRPVDLQRDAPAVRPRYDRVRVRRGHPTGISPPCSPAASAASAMASARRPSSPVTAVGRPSSVARTKSLISIR